MSLTQENRELLTSFVDRVLSQWYGLQAAVQNGMGGTPAETKSKLETMTKTIARSCSNPQTSVEEISDLLEDLTDSLFDTWFEDGSTDEVALHLWTDTRDLLAGDSNKVKSFLNTDKILPVIASSSQQIEEAMAPSSPEQDEEAMDTDTASNSEKMKSVPDPNDEGWEIPRYGRRKR